MLGIVNSCLAYNTPPKFVREAEIKHGRLAMTSSVMIPLLDNDKELGINFVSNLDPVYQFGILGIFGCSEFSQILKAYKFPNEVKDWFVLNEEHVPGDYGFDPLNISNNKNEDRIRLNEMFVGRVAMIAVTYEMINELNGNRVF